MNNIIEVKHYNTCVYKNFPIGLGYGESVIFDENDMITVKSSDVYNDGFLINSERVTALENWIKEYRKIQLLQG